jgi:hypothetical protein
MVVVAVAGASSGFGRTVLQTFLSTPHSHTFVLLSRTAQPELEAKYANLIVRTTTYGDHAPLVKTLTGVHTVLSFIGGSQKAIQYSQLAMIAAAKEAGVKRFAPSEYFAVTNEGIDLYQGKAIVWDAVVVSGLEFTRFCCGIFMQLLGTGTPKPPSVGGTANTGEEEALARLRPWNYIINMKAGTADLPAHGNDAFVVTDMHDVARFVLRALDLPKWPETLGMRGDVKTWREILALAEKVQGRTFLVMENTLEDMQKIADEVPGKRFYNQTRILIAEGKGMVPDDLNKAFPEIVPTTVDHFMERWWNGMEMDEPAWADDSSFM